MNDWMDGWMDGWMDVWMDGWMDNNLSLISCTSSSGPLTFSPSYSGLCAFLSFCFHCFFYLSSFFFLLF